MSKSNHIQGNTDVGYLNRIANDIQTLREDGLGRFNSWKKKGGTIPLWYGICNGSETQRYKTDGNNIPTWFFATYGEKFGAGDGLTTVNLPTLMTNEEDVIVMQISPVCYAPTGERLNGFITSEELANQGMNLLSLEAIESKLSLLASHSAKGFSSSFNASEVSLVSNNDTKVTEYIKGHSYSFIMPEDSNGALTIKIDELPPIPFKSSLNEDFVAGELLKDEPIIALYNGVSLVVASGGSKGSSKIFYVMADTIPNLVAPLVVGYSDSRNISIASIKNLEDIIVGIGIGVKTGDKVIIYTSGSFVKDIDDLFDDDGDPITIGTSYYLSTKEDGKLTKNIPENKNIHQRIAIGIRMGSENGLLISMTEPEYIDSPVSRDIMYASKDYLDRNFLLKNEFRTFKAGSDLSVNKNHNASIHGDTNPPRTLSVSTISFEAGEGIQDINGLYWYSKTTFTKAEGYPTGLPDSNFSELNLEEQAKQLENLSIYRTIFNGSGADKILFNFTKIKEKIIINIQGRPENLRGKTISGVIPLECIPSADRLCTLGYIHSFTIKSNGDINLSDFDNRTAGVITSVSDSYHL